MTLPSPLSAPPTVAALVIESPRLVPLVAALLAAVAVAVVILYHPPHASIRRRWWWSMIGLRLMALAALGASILKPVLQRPPRPEELGAVVVIVDRSRGTSIKDRQRTTASLVALADGLNRLGPGLRFRTVDLTAALKIAREQFGRYTAVADEINFARMNGLPAGDAVERLGAAGGEFTTAARTLARLRTHLRPKAAPQDFLISLEKLVDSFPTTATTSPVTPPSTSSLPAEPWVTSVRSALDRLGPAIGNLQAEEDARLYNSDKAVRATCDELRGLTRLGLVEQALTRPGSGLLSRLPAAVSVFGFSTAARTEPLPLKAEGRPVHRLLLGPTGPAADSGTAVRDALDQLAGVTVQAVVVFSAGHATPGKPPPAGAVPVFTVATAPPFTGRDVSLSEISVPSEVRLEAPVRVGARVRGMNLRGVAVEVRLSTGLPHVPPAVAATPRAAAWAALAASTAGAVVDVTTQRVVLGEDGTANVSFATQFDHPGPQRVQLRVADLGAETTTENNDAERWVKVLPGKRRVALLAGYPGWDFRYLRDMLLADPDYEVTSQVCGDGAPASLTPDEILSQQLIVFCDLPAVALTTPQWSAVRKLVAERGGAAVLIAGTEHLPAEYVRHDIAADFLPFAVDKTSSVPPASLANWQIWRGEEPDFQMGPFGSTEATEITRLADRPAESMHRWRRRHGFIRTSRCRRCGRRPGSSSSTAVRVPPSSLRTRSVSVASCLPGPTKPGDGGSKRVPVNTNNSGGNCWAMCAKLFMPSRSLIKA